MASASSMTTMGRPANCSWINPNLLIRRDFPKQSLNRVFANAANVGRPFADDDEALSARPDGAQLDFSPAV